MLLTFFAHSMYEDKYISYMLTILLIIRGRFEHTYYIITQVCHFIISLNSPLGEVEGTSKLCLTSYKSHWDIPTVNRPLTYDEGLRT